MPFSAPSCILVPRAQPPSQRSQESQHPAHVSSCSPIVSPCFPGCDLWDLGICGPLLLGLLKITQRSQLLLSDFLFAICTHRKLHISPAASRLIPCKQAKVCRERQHLLLHHLTQLIKVNKLSRMRPFIVLFDEQQQNLSLTQVFLF